MNSTRIAADEFHPKIKKIVWIIFYELAAQYIWKTFSGDSKIRKIDINFFQ